jgi:LPS export ABC transporter protein LptC
MSRWQRRARLAIAISALGFAAVVVFALKKRDAQSTPVAAVRTDPSAVVEVTGGRVERFKLSREDVRVAYERQLTYADGATKLVGVTITADERAGGRTFTVTGNEGSVGQNESLLQLTGDVRVTASDGLTVRTDHASYSDRDGIVRATGRVEFSRNRLTGSGTGLSYDTVRDALVISNQAVVHVAPDERGFDRNRIGIGDLLARTHRGSGRRGARGGGAENHPVRP